MDFIVFAEDWGGHPSSSQHIVSRLIRRGHRVVWFNSIGLRNPRVTLRDVKRLFTKLAGAFRSDADAPREHGLRPLETVQSVVFPKPDNALFRLVNRHILSRKVREAVDRYKLENPVLWITTPTAECVCDAAPYSSILYYCCDDYGGLPGVDADFVRVLEERLARQADVVVVTNPLLGSRFPKEKVALVPHGVDYDLFLAPAERPEDLPSGPVVGYYGSISDWVDVELLAHVAQALPGWNLVLIGDVQTDISRLSGLENVHFLGPRPHEALPGYSRNWDVSILPFVLNSQIEHCNPLKLREYLAAGSPVVSVDFPAVREYASVVSIVEPGDRDGFVRRIIAAAEQGGGAENRQGAVKDQSWESRAQAIEVAVSGFTQERAS